MYRYTSGDAVFKGIVTPRAETATHYLTMAFHEDLDRAEELALLDMLTWMHRLTGRVGTPGGVYQIGYMDRTGCRQLNRVLTGK